MLLVPLLLAMVGLARDRDLMGRFVTGRAGTLVYAVTTVVVVVCVVTLGITTLLAAVPVALGAAHQGGALLFFAVALMAAHCLRADGGVGVVKPAN